MQLHSEMAMNLEWVNEIDTQNELWERWENHFNFLLHHHKCWFYENFIFYACSELDSSFDGDMSEGELLYQMGTGLRCMISTLRASDFS